MRKITDGLEDLDHMMDEDILWLRPGRFKEI